MEPEDDAVSLSSLVWAVSNFRFSSCILIVAAVLVCVPMRDEVVCVPSDSVSLCSSSGPEKTWWR